MDIEISTTRDIKKADIVALYQAHAWSSAEKPDQLYAALMNSHALFSAWDGKKLIGLANAISDGHLVVYYPHILVDPAYMRKGVGRKLVSALQSKYAGFHMQSLTADADAVSFYESMGFSKASETKAMWIYDGDDH